ncbi:hypothetical protein [Proteiniclasticum sp.]|uniref:alpha/beta hydrolase family protein n=1 Tax=Proteiniclasticum sp. TaxID=2053595 RepID=UPI00289E3860|nr:hypothetical protein [Proteiniclasticum sp.]
MGTTALILLITLEAVLFFWSIRTKNNLDEEKRVIHFALLALFILLVSTGIFEWSFRYMILAVVLTVQAAASGISILRKKTKPFKTGRSVIRFVKNSFIFTLALSAAIIFPQYEQPAVSGDMKIETAKYTWTDPDRVDIFSKNGEKRAVTVEFWYPEDNTSDYPLVIFSHGAFGFSGSNYSTFAELASNGYVVASIGHTGQAFFTLDTKGTLTTVDSSFISRASEINAVTDTAHAEDIYKTTKEWMELRTGDEDFVIDSILSQCSLKPEDPLFSIIDTEKIGLMGHSLGGATSAQIGRERDDIDAVIVLDGTMLGEEIAFENNKVVINDKPYPVPLLNIYAEDHYDNAIELEKDTYSNFIASKNGICTYETVFKNAGHLNFTDLPLFSPVLAKTLGVGTVDSRECIETMNNVVLTFFNSYLKDSGVPVIEKEY